MSELNLPCSPGGTLIDLHMDSLSDSDDGQDDVKKRKLMCNKYKYDNLMAY